MKYLLFNLLVVGALAFLLFDGDPPATVRGAVDKVMVKVDRLVARGKALVAEPTTERPVGRTVRVTRTPLPKSSAPAKDSRDKPVVSPPVISDRTAGTVVAPGPRLRPAATASRPATPAPRPAKPRKANDAPARALDTEIARRRAEVLGEEPRMTTQTATAELMAPRVRRSELNKLAEDMELMFVEKVSR